MKKPNAKPNPWNPDRHNSKGAKAILDENPKADHAICPHCGSKAVVEIYDDVTPGRPRRKMRKLRCMKTSLALYESSRCPAVLEVVE